MLETSLDTICFIIVKVRALDAREGVVEGDPASNPSDDDQIQALAGHAGDLSRQELHSFIDTLNDDAKAELVALVRLARGDESLGDWPGAIERARNAGDTPTADWLLDTPLLGDLLEDAINRFGLTCEEIAMDRL